MLGYSSSPISTVFMPNSQLDRPPTPHQHVQLPARADQARKSTGRVAGWLSTTVGLLSLVYMGITGAKRVLVSSGWPSVEATVTKTSLEALERYIKSEKRNSTTFWLTIEVRYTVDGKDYLSKKTDIYEDFQTAVVQSLRREYAQGTHHQIFYNPARPQEIVLTRPSGLAFWWDAVIGASIEILSGVFYGTIITGLGIWLIQRSR